MASLQPFRFLHLGYVRYLIIGNSPKVTPELFFTPNDCPQCHLTRSTWACLKLTELWTPSFFKYVHITMCIYKKFHESSLTNKNTNYYNSKIGWHTGMKKSTRIRHTCLSKCKLWQITIELCNWFLATTLYVHQ